MSEICQKCGLPKDLCVCETIAKEVQKIYVKTVKRRYGKISTIIEGIDPKSINIKEMAKKLKSELACGGTVKDNIIELQGDHKKKAKEILIRAGFSEEQITMS
jgi:translation initiation factor 1